MAEFGATTVDSLIVLAAASAPNNPVRLVEFEAELDEINATLADIAEGHSALTITPGSNSIDLQLDGQALLANLILASNSGLEVVEDGTRVVFGTEENQVARGNHSHAQLHDALTVNSSTSISLSLVEQDLDAVVLVDGTRAISIDANGVGVVFGTSATTVSAGNHTHAAATSSAAGFMSASDKVKLDGISVVGDTGYVNAVTNTSTVLLAVASGELTATVNFGSGLEISGGQLVVDFDAVAALAHSHSNASTGTAGFLSVDDKLKLNALATNGTFDYDNRYVKLAGGQTMTGLLTLSAGPSSNSHPATKLYVDTLIAAFSVTDKVDKEESNDVDGGYFEIRNQVAAAEIGIIGVDTGIFHFDAMSGAGGGGSDGRAGAYSASPIGGTDGETNPMLVSRIGMIETLFRKTLTAPNINDAVVGGAWTFGVTGDIQSPTLTGNVSGAATYRDPTIKVYWENDPAEALLLTISPAAGGTTTGTPEPTLTISDGNSNEWNFGGYWNDGSEDDWGFDANTVLRRGDVEDGGATAIEELRFLVGNFRVKVKSARGVPQVWDTVTSLWYDIGIVTTEGVRSLAVIQEVGEA